jgi:hypothetical protein
MQRKGIEEIDPCSNSNHDAVEHIEDCTVLLGVERERWKIIDKR